IPHHRGLPVPLASVVDRRRASLLAATPVFRTTSAEIAVHVDFSAVGVSRSFGLSAHRGTGAIPARRTPRARAEERMPGLRANREANVWGVPCGFGSASLGTLRGNFVRGGQDGRLFGLGLELRVELNNKVRS